MITISTQIQPYGINIKIPEKVFFSNDPKHYTVKNDFYFTIYKSSPDNNRLMARQTGSGETYPAIYIKGLEQLFDNLTQAMQLDAFCKMFHTSGNTDWSISYGHFRDTEETCVVITTAAISLETDFSVKFQLSDKCAFTNIPDVPDLITLEIYIDDFDCFFSGLPNRIAYNIVLERAFAVYIENFGAYLGLDTKNPVSAVHKGDSCYISWNIEQNEKASTFLYDEDGAVIANLPPYTAKIDRNRKFTLTAYNDFCSVTNTVHVYRTLWQKEETDSISLPQTDEKWHCKIYQSENDTYYLYVHPNLYTSEDLAAWKITSENTYAPSDFYFYSSAFSEDRACVCYLSDQLFTYCELNFSDKSWKKDEIQRSGLLCAYASITDTDKTVITLASKNDIGFYDLVNGLLMNARFLNMPEDACITAADIYSDDSRDYLAFLCKNKRVYFYDLHDDYKNNIFECPGVTGDSICLLHSNALYIALNGGMLEVSDREKFTDTHFFPEFKQGTRPVMGTADSETIIGFFQTENDTEMWKYKF